MIRWGIRRLYLEFGRDGSRTSYSFDSSREARAAHWQRQLDLVLHEGLARLEVESLPDAAGRVADLSSARAARVTVHVQWSVAGGRRRLTLVTVRI